MYYKYFITALIIGFFVGGSIAVNLPFRLKEIKSPADISAVMQNFDSIILEAQDKKFDIVLSTPTNSEGNNGNIKLLNTSSIKKLFAKINGVWYSVELK